MDYSKQGSSSSSNGKSGPKPHVTMKDMLDFVESVRAALGHNSDGFINLFKDYMGQRVEVRQIIPEAKVLLKKHRELVVRFNLFLPPGYEISIPHEDTAASRNVNAQLEEAIQFVMEVKEQLCAECYASFLNLLHQYRDNNISRKDVCSEIRILLSDRPLLLEGFQYYACG